MLPNAIDKRLIIGLGATGHAIAGRLQALNLQFEAADTRDDIKLKTQFESRFPNCKISIGPLNTKWLDTFDEIVVSPGVAPATPGLADTITPQISDIELFRRGWPLNQSLIAITGSNAKSTVTSLVADILRANGKKVLVGGNLGTQALDLLKFHTDDAIVVLELSSFQLERTINLQATVATCLNMSPDHLDWHGSMDAYYQAKHRIFRGAKSVVVNADDHLSMPKGCCENSTLEYTLYDPDVTRFGITVIDGQEWIALGSDPWMPLADLPTNGLYMRQNVMAALALCFSFNLDKLLSIQAIRRFKQLPHRMQELDPVKGIRFINDSKGTNVGASENAIRSTSLLGSIHLIAGGEAKGADLNKWAETAAQYCRSIVVYGRDRQQFVDALSSCVTAVESLDRAFSFAVDLADPGDVVLFSPACSSFDQFQNYQSRGRYFMHLVEKYRES